MNAEEFKNIRLELGVSRPKLSKKLGKTKGMIERYENGKSPINETVALLMKNFLLNNI